MVRDHDDLLNEWPAQWGARCSPSRTTGAISLQRHPLLESSKPDRILVERERGIDVLHEAANGASAISID